MNELCLHMWNMCISVKTFHNIHSDGIAFNKDISENDKM
jgi:hypothetical protein